MKNTWLILATAISMMAVSTTIQAITLNFSTTGNNAGVVFNPGGTFDFQNASSGYSYDITSVNDGAGDSVGDLGNINGTFTIGTITTLGSLQSAPVSGSGTVTINDGSKNLTGTVTWQNIYTLGGGGGLGIAGVLNLTSISYGGSQSDLLALAAAGSASDVISFQISSPNGLSYLVNNGGTTSFSGSIAVPEGGSTAAMLGLAMSGLGLMFVRKARCA